MTYQASETILDADTYRAGMDASKLLTSHEGVVLLLERTVRRSCRQGTR
ncbi:hypothetical protein [Saccharothrix deserti]|nr:hypothetical protein [Saccharothrix deserti]